MMIFAHSVLHTLRITFHNSYTTIHHNDCIAYVHTLDIYRQLLF